MHAAGQQGARLGRIRATWHAVLCAAALAIALVVPRLATADDWLTFGHDPQRTGWAGGEHSLTVRTVRNLELKWKVHLPDEPLSLTALTAPLVASDVTTAGGVKTLVYVAGSSDHVFAVDAANGKVAWTVALRSSLQPPSPGMWLCPNNLNATPTIDPRAALVYVLAADGRLYGLTLGAGQVKFGPARFVPPYAKDWSLNLIRGVIYTTTSQGCANARSGIYAMDVEDPARPVIRALFDDRGESGGIWGRGAVTAGAGDRIFAATGDGPTHPSMGQYGTSVIAVSTSKMTVADYYTPTDHRLLTRQDLDLGASSPAWLAHGTYHLLAAGGKGGTLYLLNADRLGGADHQTPLQTLRLANDERAYEANGIWGGFATWQDGHGDRWLFVPVWGPASKHAPRFLLSHGLVADGSLMAFKVGLDTVTRLPRLEAMWVSRDLNLPEPPVIADGVVFDLSTGENPLQTLGTQVVTKPGKFGSRILTNQEREEHTQRATLYALDAHTGKVLYSSRDAIATWVHFSGLAVANGRVYVVDHHSNLYCFGLKGK